MVNKDEYKTVPLYRVEMSITFAVIKYVQYCKRLKIRRCFISV